MLVVVLLAADVSSTNSSYTHDFGGAEKMVELIQSYPELCSSIDRVASRPFDPDIDVRADDFPVGNKKKDTRVLPEDIRQILRV